MERRPLGASGLELPVVTLGAWAMGGTYWGGADDARSRRALVAAVEAGMTAVDTAPIYGFGRSERVAGEALAGRSDVQWLTKCGLRWDDPEQRGQFFYEGELLDDRGVPTGRRVKVYRNSRPDSVRLECERSLRRLQTDCLDLYQVHWHDGSTPIEETMGALLELRAAGKIRAIGVSNFGPNELERARVGLGDVPLASDQPRYSLVQRGIEADVLPWCREHGVGVLAYSPLEQGLLTGRVRPGRSFAREDRRPGRAAFRPANRDAINGALDRVAAPIATAHGATLGQVALAWVLGQPGITAVLAGVRDEAQARENAGAGSLVLEPGELAALRSAFGALALDLAE